MLTNLSSSRSSGLGVKSRVNETEVIKEIVLREPNYDALKDSSSSYRKNCFNCRSKMIKESFFQFWIVSLTGVAFILGPWIMIIIVYHKYINLQK